MSAESVVAVSARVEQLLVAAVLVLAVVWLRRRRSMPPGRDLDFQIARGQEAVLLAALLAGAVLTRTLGWDRPLTALFWFSEVSTLHIAKLLREGGWWTRWVHSLGNSQVGWAHDSPILLPIATTFQYLLGPALHLPVLVGAFWGVGGVLLAWAFGRAWRSPAYGLVLGALVAASPLQIVWSRLGGYYVACVPHILLTMWIGFEAGRRGRAAWALLAALAVWTSLYHYYPARVAMPLGILAMLAGAQRARVPLGRTAGMVLVVVGVVAVFYLIAVQAGFSDILWPRYRGYVGGRGEENLREVVEQNAEQVKSQFGATFARYFVGTRTAAGWGSLKPGWGMQYGGLCLVPVAILGLAGLWHVLRSVRTEWLLLALAMAGVMVPTLSFMNARRALALDLAWCALAAHGLLALARLALRAGVRPRLVAAAVPLLLVGLGAWSFGSIVALTTVLPRGHSQPMPFGESGFGDGITCPRCMEAAHEWQGEIERGAFVVSFDNDLARENATSPGGLVTLGRVAALAAGRPQNFVEVYDLMRNLGGEPGLWGTIFDESKDDFASYLDGLLDAAAPDVILWHFEHPTAWERWVADRLVAAGGTAREFATPLSTRPGLQVRTPATARGDISLLLHGLADAPPNEVRCITLTERARTEVPFPALTLSAASPAGRNGSPAWIVGGWDTVLYDGLRYPMPPASGAALAREDGGERLHLLSREGQDWMYDLGKTVRTERKALPGTLQGVDCAERVGGEWWLVDPVTGEVRTTAPGGPRLPAERWTGIARGPHDQLVLASADQFVAVFDPSTQAEIRRFPATVRPSRQVFSEECAPILAGDGWYGTYAFFTGTLRIYDGVGRRVGLARLARLLAVPRTHVAAIAGQGAYVGVAFPNEIRTHELGIAPGCVDETRPVP